MTCYITFYYDIKRENWPNQFKRCFNDYLKTFEPFITLFNKETCEEDEMIVFIDSKHFDTVQNLIKSKPTSNISLYHLNDDIMNELPMWKTLEVERQIMNLDSFKNLVGERIIYPEHIYPEYTLINHVKIDMVCKVIEENLSKHDVFAWVDFGFFSNGFNVPTFLLDISNFNLDKINYSLINPIEKIDFQIEYTLKKAPEVIGGFFFLGRKDKLLEYQKLYYETLDYFQNTLKIADDDQHLVLQCYKKKTELFSFNNKNYGWHKVLKANQKKLLKVISFCLWGNEKKYTIGLIQNIKLVSKFYPDWKCWIYVHVQTVNENYINILKSFDNVRIFLKSDPVVRSKRFMLWRLEPILNFSVERFISRDTDTRISPREVLAVIDWIDSNKTLHIMRDHPQHYPKILGGMYGVKCSKNLNDFDWIFDIEKYYIENGEEMDDQGYLEKTFYNMFQNDRIIHDEIKKYEGDECKNFSLPFEKNGHFVGCYIYEDESTDDITSKVLLDWLQNNLPNRISNYEVTILDKLEFISSKIKNIYIIHYTKLVSRKNNIIRELKRNFLDKFFKINWVDNFDRENISEHKIKNSCIFNPDVLNRFMTLPEIANGLAHIDTIEKIRDSNDEISLVLEDDTVFKDDFIHHLYFVLKNLPDDFESICLGGPSFLVEMPCKTLECSIKTHFRSDEIIFFKPETPAPMTLSAMMYSQKSVQKISSSMYFKPFSAPSDHSMWVCNIDKNVSMYYIQPFITYEASKTDLFETSMDRGF
jgi:GR25 family glycosyltransferase involved in LPS biosynthesis